MFSTCLLTPPLKESWRVLDNNSVKAETEEREYLKKLEVAKGQLGSAPSRATIKETLRKFLSFEIPKEIRDKQKLPSDEELKKLKDVDPFVGYDDDAVLAKELVPEILRFIDAESAKHNQKAPRTQRSDWKETASTRKSTDSRSCMARLPLFV